MPIVKPISGHTDAQRIQHYLEKDGRALARDFYNLSWDEDMMAGYDPSLKVNVAWANEMDHTRHAYQNDLPHGGRAARTFKHFVISPNPEDNLDLPRLRELTCAWVKECFADYQVAIIYHDDNVGHIPHAHVVVNNTNLVTGNRLHTDSPKSLNKLMQQMAQKRGLHFLKDEIVADDGFAALAAKGADAAQPVLTRQEAYLSWPERRALISGEYSWVSDIRDRVTLAKRLAGSTEEFMQILDTLDVDIYDSSAKSKREEWLFELRDQGAKRVRGDRLGYGFGKEALTAKFALAGSTAPARPTAKAFIAAAAHAAQINDLEELHTLSNTLDVNIRFHIQAQSDYGKRIDSLERKMADEPTAKLRANTLASIMQLQDARNFSAAKELLPNERPKPAKKKLTPAQKSAATKRKQAVKSTSTGSGRGRHHQIAAQTRSTKKR